MDVGILFQKWRPITVGQNILILTAATIYVARIRKKDQNFKVYGHGGGLKCNNVRKFYKTWKDIIKGSNVITTRNVA